MRRWGAVVSVISVCMLGCEQDLPEGVIARVGERDIDAQAFAVAARKVVGEDLALGSINAAGKRALLDIILARELLTLEGKRRGIDREEVVRRELDALERKLLSEELYQREIEAGLAVAEEEIERQYEAWGSGEEIMIAHIQCDTREEALDILEEVEKGGDFAELAHQRSLHAPSAMQGGVMGYVRQSQVLPAFRAPLWQWPIGQIYPEPIETSLGYHVTRVQGRRQRTLEQQREILTRAVERQKKGERKKILQEDLARDFHLQWHATTLVAMAGAGKELAGDLLLCEWDGGGLSTAEYLRRMTGQKVIFRDTVRIRQVAKRQVVEELAALEARRRGLDQLVEVRRQVEGKEAQLLGARLFESEIEKQEIGGEQLQAFYQDNKEKYRGATAVTIREILVADRDLADSLYALILGGQDLAELARRYSLRSDLKEKGGMWENVDPTDPRTMRIYRTALEGEGLQEPIKVTAGFSIFEVLDKQPGPIRAFAEVAERVQSDVENRAMDRFIGQLKQKYRDAIIIDEQALNDLR